MIENSYEEGRLLLINKPINWTSFDVVKKIRGLLKIKKIGHAGTLDPLATGLLVIGTGKFTKKLTTLQGLNKTYEGIIEIGKTTPSYDLETSFDSETEWSAVTPLALEKSKEQLMASTEQIPPIYSAIKVGGERAYKKARKKQEVTLNPKLIKIYTFDIDYTHLPEITFKIICSKGTYIRSIAHDFGKNLGVGAYLKKLVRTKVGDFNLADALNLEEVTQKNNESNRTD